MVTQNYKNITERIRKLSGKYSPWQVWADFVVMTACSISNVVDLENKQKREKDYMDRANKYSSEEMAIFAEMMGEIVQSMEKNPDQDLMGEIFMRSNFGNDAEGQFFTPYNLCVLNAKLCSIDTVKGQIEKSGFVCVNDCACGAGALLVAFANECRRNKVNYQTSVFFTAQDIDYITALMCYIQLSLLGCPGYVYIGDTLSNPARTIDGRGLVPIDSPNTWLTPMYFSHIWTFRRLGGLMDAGCKRKIERAPIKLALEKGKPIKPPKQKINEVGQMTFFL